MAQFWDNTEHTMGFSSSPVFLEIQAVGDNTLNKCSFWCWCRKQSLGILGDFFQVQWATCLSLQWYDSNGLSHHSERQIHEAAACVHGPSIGLILLWADGSPSPYSTEAVIKTSVMDNSSYQKLHQKHVKGADCPPAGFRKWVLTWVCTILISNQPFPILQKASKISKGRLRLVRMDLCKTKIDLILNSMTFFPQCNRFFFRNYSKVIEICKEGSPWIFWSFLYYLSSRKVISSNQFYFSSQTLSVWCQQWDSLPMILGPGQLLQQLLNLRI